MKIRIKATLILTIISIIVIVPSGFIAKYYNGKGDIWVNNSFAGLLYEVFWCLVFYLFFPKTKPLTIVLFVFFGTCILEFLQLCHLAFLEIPRSTILGQAILGNAFNPSDFLYYAIGSFLGWLWIRGIIKLSKH